MTEIPKTQKERDELLKTFLIGEELEAEYDEICNQSLKVAKKIDALIDKINEAKSKIIKATHTKDEPIIIDHYWTRKICELDIENWVYEIEPLYEELDKLTRERNFLHLQMKNKVAIGLYDGLNMVAKKNGKEPKVFTGLSVLKD